MSATPKRRIFELDLLRGFFICVIILDHLQFWPSPFQYLTGEGRLWSSAAEGFFLISGLLVGYLRAYKGANTPLKLLSRNLLLRAAMLYMWCVIITFIVVALTALFPDSAQALLPKLPESSQVATLPTYLYNVISTTYASDWIYFLRLYAIVLAATPVFLYLIRRKLWWVAALISMSLYSASLVFQLEEAFLQWQVYFFGAALIGWKLEAILTWLRSRPKARSAILTSLVTIALGTMAVSYFMVHGWNVVESPHPLVTREAYVSVRATVDPLFSNNPVVPLRIAISFLWFSGLLALFHVIKPFLMKWLGWLLLPFGQSSLTVYTLQALVLGFIVSYVPLTAQFWLNGLIGALVIMLFAGLIRIPIIQRVLPR